VVRTAPITDASGDVIAVMEMCTNVTELRVIENQLAMLGETIAGTSHAIKNILSGLEGGVYIVDSGLTSGRKDRLKSGWTIVKKNVVKISELVKDILYASKPREPELRLVSPCLVIEEALELFDETARTRGIRLVRECDDGIGKGMLDAHGIHNVITNLISNAFAACLESKRPEGHRIVVWALVDGPWLVIEVADDGQGMPDEVKQNLFKKFYSTKGTKGTGLGLLVTRKIIQENGGTITVESTFGEGTRFTIKVPFQEIGTNGPVQAPSLGNESVREGDREPQTVTCEK
jgi:signal transduction histidine kinase